MGLINTVKHMFGSNLPTPSSVGGSETVLLFSLEEVPNPRDTGTLYVSCGSRLLFFVRVSLDQAGIDATLAELSRTIDQIRACSFTEIRFDNVSPQAQKQIEAHLASFYIPSRDHHRPVMA